MDKTQVRTAADLEKKYNFPQMLGLTKNIENTEKQLIKIQNELNNMLNSLVINLGDLLDSQSSISLWFYDGTPTTSNEPYTDWNDPTEHYGDFYYDRLTGYVYKFTENDWEQQDDTNLINAMALTNVELDVENDHERQVFFDTPIPPYQSGDWWILEDGTLMICQIGKPAGETYEEYDFINSSRYTDTVATKIGEQLTVTMGSVAIIRANLDSISSTVAQTTTTLNNLSEDVGGQLDSLGNDLSGLQQTVQTNWEQTATSAQLTFLQGIVNGNKDEIDSTIATWSSYIRFENGDILLGETGNLYRLRIENDRIQIYYNDVPQSNWIKDTFTAKQVNMGNLDSNGDLISGFGFIPRDNGSLSFKKIK